MTEAELNQLISDAGIGPRSAKKLRDANAKRRGTATTPASAGHGAPSIDRTPVPSM